jgi:general secretion pathway protein H
MTRATSSAGELRRDGNQGFALYELILVLAILAMVAGVIYPRAVRDPGPAEVRAAAENIAAILRSDRNAALRQRHAVVSRVDVETGVIRAGASDGVVAVPGGVKMEFVQSSRELGGSDGSGIRFRPNGRSSGGVLTLSRDDFAYRISVNWLTAGVRVVRLDLGRSRG